jgi:hypothetical protein
MMSLIQLTALHLKPGWVTPSAYPTYLVYLGQVNHKAPSSDNDDQNKKFMPVLYSRFIRDFAKGDE